MCKTEFTVLAGGVGAARFLSGLIHVIPPETIAAIVNTGDDLTLYGLYISPDIDIIMYTLAGIANPDQGWGVANDSFHCLSMLDTFGHSTWFNLGDKDLATHIHRTFRLQQGWTLDQITEEIRIALNIKTKIIPMTNHRVMTKINTGTEILPFQEYFVKRNAKDRVKKILFEGIDDACPAPMAIEAMETAKSVIIAPSNPFVSIGPILSVKGVRNAIRSTNAVVAAISPIVCGAAIKGPAARMMGDLGHEVSALGIARIYHDLLDVMIIDEQDKSLKHEIEELGIRAVVTDTIMSSFEKKISLSNTVLKALEL
jgi:LPPG:FO 2-phospho-L-lactate transferase